uniref:Uncharacterized protein n=1 Tax=Octopus bimaculoides TaxID=37653 RepID=A0A0L8FGA9_OCTBM
MLSLFSIRISKISPQTLSFCPATASLVELYFVSIKLTTLVVNFIDTRVERQAKLTLAVYELESWGV